MGIVSVIVDSREPDFVKRLTFGGVPVAVTMLDAGDLLIATETHELLAVERKEASDFLNSIRDERLWPQLARLRQTSPFAYLALCGTLQPGADGKCYQGGRETGWSWASVAGALLTVQEIGVHVLHIASDHEFERAIVALAERDRGTMRVRPARDIEFVSDAEAILMALPGIGQQKAQALIAYCGTPARALQYLTDDDWDGPTAPGIGEGIRRRIRKALALPEWGALAVIIKETGNVPEKEKVS